MRTLVKVSDGRMARVRLTGLWVPSLLQDDGEPVDIDRLVTVVRARKGLFGSIPWRVDVAIEGWFVAYTEEGVLPFNFSSKPIPPRSR